MTYESKGAQFLLGMGKLAGAMIAVLTLAAILGTPMIREIARTEARNEIGMLKADTIKALTDLAAKSAEERKEIISLLRDRTDGVEKLVNTAIDRVEKRTDRIEQQLDRIILRLGSNGGSTTPK